MPTSPETGTVPVVDMATLVTHLGQVQQEHVRLLAGLERRLQTSERRLDHELQMLYAAIHQRPVWWQPAWLPLLALAVAVLGVMMLVWGLARC